MTARRVRRRRLVVVEADTAFENGLAESANAEAGMQMRIAETVANGRNHLADLLALTLRQAANRSLELRDKLNPRYLFRCRH